MIRSPLLCLRAIVVSQEWVLLVPFTPYHRMPRP